jgi:twitching motility protein PilT
MSLLDVAPIIEQMLLISDNVSDLNFSTGQKPQVEISGSLYSASPLGLGKLTGYQTEMIAMAILRDNSGSGKSAGEIRHGGFELCAAGRCRFRVNIFQQRGSYSIVMRVIPHEIPSFESPKCRRSSDRNLQYSQRHRAVDRSDRFGKKLDARGDHRPHQRNEKLSHRDDRRPDRISSLAQKMHDQPARSRLRHERFRVALRAALRQAPKVILVGEMRDLETAEIALEAAETGHLVLSTLHTIDASKTVDRIIGLYPKNEEKSFARGSRKLFATSFRSA